MERRIAAILAADMVGFSRLVELDEAGTIERQKRHRLDLIDPLFEQFNGHIVKLTGDGLIAEFGSVVEAVQCAVNAQTAMEQREAGQPEDRKIRYRIAIHLGDVIFDEGDVFGDGVNIAARLESLAEPGGVVVSGPAHDLLKAQVAVGFKPMGDQKLKNISEPVRVYQVVPQEQDLPSDSMDRAKRPRGVFVVAAAVACIALLMWAFLPTDTPSPAATGEKPRIAVLPFDDFSTGDNKGYLSDAIAEGIITELARSSVIDVIARNSSFRYRDTEPDIRKIGEELGAHYVLEGSQQKNGDSLRVTVQLVETENGTHLWAHTYDQEIGDLFAVQDAIIKTAADRIGVRIRRPVPGHDPNKVTALHLYLKGLEIVRRNMNAELNAELMELNRRVIEIDPDSQYGYIGLAHAYRAAATFGWMGLTEQEALDKGFEAARKALEIAPEDPDVHYILARLHTENNDLDQAMAAYDKAIALNPSASTYLVASTDTMLYVGQKEEAIERIEQAMGIDPFHPEWFHWQMGWALWEVEDCEGALASMLRMNTIRRSAHRMLAGIYACLGDVEKAQEAYKVFYAEANEPTISEQREEWEDLWTAPGSLERWLDHMRIAGMQD